MLPTCRTPEDVYTLPQFDINTGEVEGFLDELRAFHAAFRECFGRSEPRDSQDMAEVTWPYITIMRTTRCDAIFEGEPLAFAHFISMKASRPYDDYGSGSVAWKM